VDSVKLRALFGVNERLGASLLAMTVMVFKATGELCDPSDTVNEKFLGAAVGVFEALL
jgi:hypothetical protein